MSADNNKSDQPEAEVPIRERVSEIICEQLSVSASEVIDEATFVNDLNADSLDMVELMMALEEEFGIEISEDQAEQIQNVGDAIGFIEQRLKG